MWGGESHDPLVEVSWTQVFFTFLLPAIPRCGMVGLMTCSSRRVGYVFLVYFLLPAIPRCGVVGLMTHSSRRVGYLFLFLVQPTHNVGWWVS